MKFRKGRQSNNVEIRDAKDSVNTKRLMDKYEERKNNPLTVNNGEPIAYAVDGKGGPNPGTKSAASKNPAIKDPAPGRITKGSDNYTEVPFFQHTIKDN